MKALNFCLLGIAQVILGLLFYFSGAATWGAFVWMIGGGIITGIGLGKQMYTSPSVEVLSELYNESRVSKEKP